MRKYQVGVIQMDTQQNTDENLKAACSFIDEAVSKGAKLVSFPEVFNVIDKGDEPPEDIPEGKTISLMVKKAREFGIWIHCGSITETNRDSGNEDKRKYNTTVMLNPKGEIIAKYRKLHTFDITLQDGTQTRESARIKPGKDMVNVDTELGNLGFSICYDIRFPELYRYLALKGAQVIFTPANFAMPTGKDHWEAILKTRAVENGCYIIAAAQTGKKDGLPYAFGASMVVDPWGTVIARAKESTCVTMAEIDLDYLDKVRGMLPMLVNRRNDVYDIENRN